MMRDLVPDTNAIEWLGVRYRTIPLPDRSNGAMSIDMPAIEEPAERRHLRFTAPPLD